MVNLIIKLELTSTDIFKDNNNWELYLTISVALQRVHLSVDLKKTSIYLKISVEIYLQMFLTAINTVFISSQVKIVMLSNSCDLHLFLVGCQEYAVEKS